MSFEEKDDDPNFVEEDQMKQLFDLLRKRRISFSGTCWR